MRGDLPVAAQAGGHIQTLLFVVAVLFHLSGKCRAGTHDAHITLQDVPQLGQLIEAGLADKLARAVAALPMLAEYCLPLVKVGGNFLAMKGASGEEELTAARGAIKKLGGEYRETRTLHLPGGDTRTLILCKKISQTPTAYPRNGGKIAKSPLK